jgi:hypothetical protein
VPLGAADEHGHLVEAHSTFGKAKNTACDLRALQRFAGGREDLDRVVWIATRGGFAGEYVSLQRIELRECFGGFSG